MEMEMEMEMEIIVKLFAIRTKPAHTTTSKHSGFPPLQPKRG